ncbi:BgtA-20582, partial [Blumeria graminis f. sp. tritici]
RSIRVVGLERANCIGVSATSAESQKTDVVNQFRSFLAGSLPLSMSLSPTRVRLISCLGMGILVGTSMIVIIPEGIETIYAAGSVNDKLHIKKDLYKAETSHIKLAITEFEGISDVRPIPRSLKRIETKGTRLDMFPVRRQNIKDTHNPSINAEKVEMAQTESYQVSGTCDGREDRNDPSTFHIGLSLVLGFILMFLIDKLPRHASDNLQSAPPTRHISLSNLSLSSSASDNGLESEYFLQSTSSISKQTRSLTTTTGLVIHAATDGIAMGASTTSSNSKLGLIIFIAIMIHKAPAAFGLTSVLLKQGLSAKAVRGHLIIFSLATPLGALTTWLLIALLGGSHIEGERGRWWTGMILLFSAGTFLYVAVHTLQEETTYDARSYRTNETSSLDPQRKTTKPKMRETLAVVSGMLLPLLTQLDHNL